MKYIDADRLRKEVRRLEKGAHKSALGCADSETRKFHEGKDFAYQYVGALIASLRQVQPEDVVVVAKTFLDALSKTSYNNKPITDAQIIVKQLLLFFENPKEYNPDAISEQQEVDLNGKVTFDNKTILRVETDEKKKRVLEIIGLEESCCNYPLNYENETDDCYYEEYNDRIYIDGNITFNQMREIVEYIENK